MKEFEDYGRKILEQIVDDLNKEEVRNNPFLTGLRYGMEDVLVRYKKYFPEEALIAGLKSIELDKYFKEPEAIKSETGKMQIAEFLRKFELLTWKSIILKRFCLYAFIRAISEVIKQNFINEKGENSILIMFMFTSALRSITKAGTSNFKSLTANSSNQEKVTSIKIPSIEPLVAAFEPHITSLNKSLSTGEALGWSEERTLKFQKYIAAMDMDIIEKDIFNGIQNTFEVTKLNKKGEQSERYKVLLLCNLFKHTHPKLYHTAGLSNGKKTRDELNAEALLKLIGTPGSEFFE